MKRLHAHVSVENLQESVNFYSALFAAEPSVLKHDYAKWTLEDPRVNFAISVRGSKPGLDHLGIQVESDDELREMHQRLQQAELPAMAQTGTTCCYAKSDKYWSVDPSGIAWETFHTLESVPMFSEAAESGASACCAPAAEEVGAADEAGSSCCKPRSACC